MKWEYTQLRFVPRGKSWTGEIEELWLDDRQIISRSHPQRDVTLVGLMNELGDQGWELTTYAQPFTGYHGGCYTFKRQKGTLALAIKRRSEFLPPHLEVLKGDHQVAAVHAAVAVAGSVQRAINALKHANGVTVAGGYHWRCRHGSLPESRLREVNAVDGSWCN